MVNAYISTRRHRRSSEVPIPDDDLANRAAPSAPTDDRLLVWRALGVLLPRQRAVLVLRLYEGLTDEEIADHLGCATGTVRSLASRAYLTLRTNSELLDRAASAPKD
jgi:RNA polymerase sigma factor (sigma-70 family)